MADYIKGRGAQVNTNNKFLKKEFTQQHIDAIDEEYVPDEKTQYFYESPKKIINKVQSADVYGEYSMNAYQGCEHGCIYCYARNAHEYWGFSAGLDFEQKIIVKKNAPELLDNELSKKNWKSAPIMLSGNTDCYQPVERKMEITRRMLQVLLKHKHPVGMITKNSLILRDIDLLQELAKNKLVHVMVSITTLKEDLRLVMEPRTATAKQRLKIIEELNKNSIPCGVMNAPIIPGLNSDEIPAVIKAAADVGAARAGYTLVRLNGAVSQIFTDWVTKNFPDASQKILNQIKECHAGSLSDSRPGTRMSGDGKVAEMINRLFKLSVKKYISLNTNWYEYDTQLYYTNKEKQLRLF
ncbi:MAG: PA0069 family radical SAM protein [Bacteroidetes bacterium]|nr:PA0069 family radical SAM protein [Bacteroidota bacterium]